MMTRLILSLGAIVPARHTLPASPSGATRKRPGMTAKQGVTSRFVGRSRRVFTFGTFVGTMPARVVSSDCKQTAYESIVMTGGQPIHVERMPLESCPLHRSLFLRSILRALSEPIS